MQLRPTDDTWAGFQWHAPEAGFVMAFRRQLCISPRHVFQLRGLRAEVRYSLELCFGYECENGGVVLGAALMANLTLQLPRPGSSVLVRYAPVSLFS